MADVVYVAVELSDNHTLVIIPLCQHRAEKFHELMSPVPSVITTTWILCLWEQQGDLYPRCTNTLTRAFVLGGVKAGQTSKQ